MTPAEAKDHKLFRLAHNEQLALRDPAKFLSERGHEVPAAIAEQTAAVRAAFAVQRKRHGGA